MPKRIQRKRQRGWRMPENAVYVGRPGKWGNPFVVGKPYRDLFGPAQPCTQEMAVKWFRAWLTADDGFGGKRLLEDIEALRGKNLACWCRLDRPCHADVLLEIANR